MLGKAIMALSKTHTRSFRCRFSHRMCSDRVTERFSSNTLIAALVKGSHSPLGHFQGKQSILNHLYLSIAYKPAEISQIRTYC